MTPVSFSATVTDIRLESRAGTSARWQIALDHTCFSLASRSGTLIAIAPSGARLLVPVLGVLEEQGTIWHIIEKPLTDGTKVLGTLAEVLA